MNNNSFKRVTPKLLSNCTNQKLRVIGKIKECSDNQFVIDTLEGIIKVGVS